MTEHAIGTAFGPYEDERPHGREVSRTARDDVQRDAAVQHRPSRADDSTEPSGCPVRPESTLVSLSDNGFRADPHELYRTMRHEHGPVVAVELPGGVPAWLVIGYLELHQVTGDPVLFPRDSRLWNQRANIPAGWPLLPMIDHPNPSITSTVGAIHRSRVAMVEPALESVDLVALRRTCEHLADHLIDTFCGRGTADLVADFAEPLPMSALAWLFGFTEEDGAQFIEMLKALTDGGPDAGSVYPRLAERMQQLLAAKRARPGADLVSRMLTYPASFTDAECALDLLAVVAAGYLPTVDWIGNSIRLMRTDERFAGALGGGRHSVEHAMNEVLWEDTPIQIFPGRWAASDTRLGDKDIRAGDMLLLGLAAANADPHVGRQLTENSAAAGTGNSAHFAFGHGEYRCPFAAQQIAEIIAQTGIEVLLDRLPDLDLAVPAANLVRRPSPFLRGITSLPVRFTPVRTTGTPPLAGNAHTPDLWRSTNLQY
ncbi:cytochrome P450 [Nocardia sp. NPDC050175]|uniref:cytochrome P450 n=1 Tax=Nocardia sp. NPDC050175 TaxID=3364317 RepID=UPI003793C4D4